jgi:hypothetical protein
MNTASDTGVPATGTWKIDSVHSSATFRIVHHKIATFRGHFHDVEGALVNGVLTGSVRTESNDVGSVAMFKEHMLGPITPRCRSHRPSCMLTATTFTPPAS